jgi:hypothetical protein
MGEHQHEERQVGIRMPALRHGFVQDPERQGLHDPVLGDAVARQERDQRQSHRQPTANAADRADTLPRGNSMGHKIVPLDIIIRFLFLLVNPADSLLYFPVNILEEDIY